MVPATMEMRASPRFWMDCMLTDKYVSDLCMSGGGAVGSRRQVLTSHRPSPVDAREPQRPPLAREHRPVRSRRHPVQTGEWVGIRSVSEMQGNPWFWYSNNQDGGILLQMISSTCTSPDEYFHIWCTDDCNKSDLCVVKRKTVTKEARSITMAIHGFQKVKASIMWAASVVTTAISTQITFLPVLSTKNPKTGEAGAEMMYTMLAEMEWKENNQLSTMKRHGTFSQLKRSDLNDGGPRSRYLFTALASAGEKLNFSMKNTLKQRQQADTFCQS